MKKLSVFLIIFITVLLIGIFSIKVIAKDNDGSNNVKGNSDSKSGSDNKNLEVSDSSKNSDNEKEEVKTIIDGQGKNVKVETKTKTENGKTKIEEKRTLIDENGNKVTIETETKINGKGKEKTEVKRKIITPDGREIVFKTETKIENGETKTKNSIEIKGVGVETKLSVTEKFEDGQTKLKAKLSTGDEQEIIVMPDDALQTALNELKTTNGLTFELSETVEGGVRKAVFSAKTKNPGKFLGIFNVNVDLETLVDTKTGEIIKTTNKPWWAFLVRGADKVNVCHIPEEDVNKKITLEIAIPAVKAHLAHGDSIGECPVDCGDYLVVNPEQCDDGNIVNGDGCNSLCQIEIIANEAIPPSTN